MARKSFVERLTGHTAAPQRTETKPCGWANCNKFALPEIKTPRGMLALCLEHYDQYWRWKHAPGEPNGWDDIPLLEAQHVSYRQRWYNEQKLPYQPPSLDACPPFRCVGVGANLDTWTALHGHAPREPGSDDQ